MSKPIIKFIYDLPYKARIELCNILDYNNDWKTLGGTFMKFNCYDLFQMENAILRRGSPTDELLSRWGSQNHTVIELFKHLYEMKHYRALLVLKPYVDTNYHKCIPEGCSDVKTNITPPEESTFSSEATQRSAQPNARVNFQHEASVKQENNPENQPTRKVSDPVTPLNVLGGTPHIPYEELTIATNNWNKLNVLGRGGFGTVYKGFWKSTPIAVKKLEVQRSNKSEETLNQCQREQTLRELKYLNSCRHDNILPLYGISIESGKYCLIYQFMPNGSLEDRLLLRKNTPPLQWSDRLNIAKGTALGIQFLHSREPPLIHGDIKSANILLNSHMDPVIGDFGLTQEGPIEKATHITLKRVSGTRPYLPHEFLSGKRISTKVDVYAFGIVLFEIATGLRAYDDTRKSERHLKNLVDKQSEENMYDLVDKNAQPIELKTAYKFFNIGKLSTKTLPRERPEMIQVYHELCGGETSNATGPSMRPIPSVSVPTSSGTPAMRAFELSPNALPRYKFGRENSNLKKTVDSSVPYLPAPGQMMNLPHPFLPQTGSQVKDIIRFSPQHLLPNNIRPQPPDMNSIRPQTTVSPDMINVRPPQPTISSDTNSIRPQPTVSPDMLLHQIPRSGHPNETPLPNILKLAEVSSPQQQSLTSPAPALLQDKINPESSKNQHKSSEETCSSCDHNTSSVSVSDASVEILNPESQLPSVIQNNTAIDIVPAESLNILKLFDMNINK